MNELDKNYKVEEGQLTLNWVHYPLLWAGYETLSVMVAVLAFNSLGVISTPRV